MKAVEMWAVAVVAASGALALGPAGIAAGQTTSTVAVVANTAGKDVLTDIPIGPADENESTSAGITRILLNCADAYKSVNALHGQGTYIYISKEDDGETSHVTSQITMDFLRPDKLAIICKSESEDLDCAFYADGTTSTHIAKSDEAYVTLPQPDSLAAYSENYRAGELYEEYSGALAFSVTGPVLVSEDPRDWLFDDVSRFVYEGKEDINGQQCFRVRFIQENPDVIVIIWVNEKTWLIDRTSFINSYDEDYNMVESFEEGDTATMSILTWDSQTTDSKSVKPQAFKARIPKGYEHRKDEITTKVTDNDGEGFWGNLVGLAAKTSPEETTWSLTRQTGSMELTLERFAQVKAPVIDFDQVPGPAGAEPQMVVASKDGTVTTLKGDGSVSATVALNEELDLFNLITTPTSGTLFIIADTTLDAVSAFDTLGTRLWSYRHPFTKVGTVAISQFPEQEIYVGLSGTGGMRKLALDGEVLKATTKVYPKSLSVTPHNVNRVVGSSSTKVDVMDRELRLLETYDTEEWVGPIKWDTEDKEYPIVCLAYSTDKDVLLQRRSERGEVAWTTTIQPKAVEITGSGMSWAQLPVDGKVQTCVVILMSDGSVVILTKDGKTLFRGQVAANAALVKQNKDSVVVSLMVADMNGDGTDEIYTRMHDNIMRMQVKQ